jgi:hypothetical protein
MLTRIFKRVRDKQAGEPEDEHETLGDEKAGANAVEHLGGFDPNHLIADPREPR